MGTVDDADIGFLPGWRYYRLSGAYFDLEGRIYSIYSVKWTGLFDGLLSSWWCQVLNLDKKYDILSIEVQCVPGITGIVFGVLFVTPAFTSNGIRHHNGVTAKYGYGRESFTQVWLAWKREFMCWVLVCCVGRQYAWFPPVPTWTCSRGDGQGLEGMGTWALSYAFRVLATSCWHPYWRAPSPTLPYTHPFRLSNLALLPGLWGSALTLRLLLLHSPCFSKSCTWTCTYTSTSIIWLQVLIWILLLSLATAI